MILKRAEVEVMVQAGTSHLVHIPAGQIHGECVSMEPGANFSRQYVSIMAGVKSMAGLWAVRWDL